MRGDIGVIKFRDDPPEPESVGVDFAPLPVTPAHSFASNAEAQYQMPRPSNSASRGNAGWLAAGNGPPYRRGLWVRPRGKRVHASHQNTSANTARSSTNHDRENITSKTHRIRTGLKIQLTAKPFAAIRNASMPAGECGARSRNPNSQGLRPERLAITTVRDRRVRPSVSLILSTPSRSALS